MTTTNNTFAEIAQLIKEYERVYITTHRNPEGDAIGSSLALLSVLEKLGKRTRFVLDEEIPHPFEHLPLAQRADSGLVPDDEELIIVLDCPNVDRIGSAVKELDRHKAVINIDHHLENTYFGELNYVDPAACATGELVYFLIKEFHDYLDQDTAALIYTAILTDTGSFRFANTNHNAFVISSELIQYGLDPYTIAQLVYENYSLTKMKLLGAALASLEISEDGRVGWITITRQELVNHNSKHHEVEGFVNYPRFIEGVIISIFFHEMDDKRVKVSFRSKGNANVAQFAKKWGGGGHRNAAACVLTEPIEGAKRIILNSLIPEMSETGLNNGS